VSDLVAINVLLEPDAATKVLAAELNAELRGERPPLAARVSGGAFAFDRTHLPHVTLFQQYVRRDDLPRVSDAVGGVVEGPETKGLSLRAGELVGGRLGTEPGTVVAGVEFEPAPEVRALHEELVRALLPLKVAGGSAAAFFTLEDEPVVNAETVAYVEEFVPAHSGENYTPHLTAGVGREEDVRRLARDHPLFGRVVAPIAVAVAHLGDLGTAREVVARRSLG
jgi:hypothetical protein